MENIGLFLHIPEVQVDVAVDTESFGNIGLFC